MNIGEKIRDLRIEKRMSQKDREFFEACGGSFEYKDLGGLADPGGEVGTERAGACGVPGSALCGSAAGLSRIPVLALYDDPRGNARGA